MTPTSWYAQGVLEGAGQVQDRAGLASWDALIVAAARAAGCEALLTEDPQDGQGLGGVVVVDPFVRDPSSIPKPSETRGATCSPRAPRTPTPALSATSRTPRYTRRPKA